jgi:Phosphoenolpyruvate phosphomutase
MPATPAEKRIAFRKLHETGCFVLPNPFDVGGARALQHLGFKAIASTSAGYAWSIGRPDNRITLEEVLQHLTALCDAVDLPVNADFEGGFAHKPEKVAANVARAVKTGVAGLSIEDSTGDAARPLYERAFAIERIKAARAAIDADHSGVLLTGRCEGFLVGQADLDMVIDRLKAYSEAGADCLYAPGIKNQGADISGREGRASQTGQSSDRVTRSHRRGSRRSRRPPHQRRRFAGAGGVGRFHAGGARDCGERNLCRIRQWIFRWRIEQDVQLTHTNERGGQSMPAARFVQIARAYRYLLGGTVLVGGLPARFMSDPVGAEDGGAGGRAGAAPVVTPGLVLALGVTSRMPGGAAGGDGCAVFWAVEDVPA